MGNSPAVSKYISDAQTGALTPESIKEVARNGDGAALTMLSVYRGWVGSPDPCLTGEIYDLLAAAKAARGDR